MVDIRLGGSRELRVLRRGVALRGTTGSSSRTHDVGSIVVEFADRNGVLVCLFS